MTEDGEFRFEWDEHKARINPGKHQGVTFQEASTVWGDGFAEFRSDPDHSSGEDGR